MLFYVIKEGSVEEPEKLVIELKYIHLMDIGTSGYTSFKIGDEIMDVYDKYNEAVEEGWIQGLIHSHNNMATFFSGTDDEELVDNSVGTDFYLSVIVNNEMNVTARMVYRAEKVVKTKTEKTYSLPSFFKLKNFKQPEPVESESSKNVVMCIDLEHEYTGRMGESLERLAEIPKTTSTYVTYPRHGHNAVKDFTPGKYGVSKSKFGDPNPPINEREKGWYLDKEYKWCPSLRMQAWCWKGTDISIANPKPSEKGGGKKTKGKKQPNVKGNKGNQKHATIQEIEDDFETNTMIANSLIQAIQLGGDMPDDSSISRFGRKFVLNNYDLKGKGLVVSMDNVYKAVNEKLNVGDYDTQVTKILNNIHKNFTVEFAEEINKESITVQDIKLMKYFVFNQVLSLYIAPYVEQYVFASCLADALLELLIDLEEDAEEIVFNSFTNW